jgi:hypothetical protein
VQTQLSERERNALIQLTKEGAGGDFDQFAMSELFAMGLIEVQPHDRRLILSKAGRDVYLMLKTA